MTAGGYFFGGGGGGGEGEGEAVAVAAVLASVLPALEGATIL